MKFGQLIECNMWNSFVEKSYTKYGGKKNSKKKSKLIVSLGRLKVLYSFLLYVDL